MKRSLLLFVLLSLCCFVFGQNEPQAWFVQSHHQSCTAPLTVTFKDTTWSPVRSPIVFWRWEFGDGTVDSSGPIVKHTYLQKGIFPAKLTVRDREGRQGSYSADDYQLIRIGAALQMPPTNYVCNPPQSITLRNLATSQYFDSLGTYQWLLNGNVVSTARSFQTTQLGVYQLNYTACGSTFSDSVSIVKGAISPGTSSSVAWLNDTAKLTFSVMNSPYDPSQVNEVSWAWGDGSVSVVKGLNTEVIHGYTVPGTYIVRATVRLNNPADLVCDSVGTYTVNVRAPYVTHNVWNRMDTLYTGGEKTYLISATNTGATFKWRSMDPGFVASTQTLSTSNPGKYWVEISKSGDVITDTINLMPKANFTFTIPQCVQGTSTRFRNDILVPVFDSLSSVTWHYGDGKSEVYTNSRTATYDHAYDAPGIYTVVMEARYKSGYYCTATKAVPIYPVIDWDVDIKDDTVSVPGMHILKAIDIKSVNAPRVFWYPAKRNAVNKLLSDTIQATIPGSYVAYLLDSCGIRRAADTIEVREQSTDSIAVNFTYSADKCNSRQIKLIGTFASSTNEDTVRSIKWNFGDGTTATYPAGNNTVTHNYDTIGIYTVSLSATTTAGRTFSVSKQVVVQEVAYSVDIVSDTASLRGTNILRAVKNPADAFVTWSTGSTNDTIHVSTSGYYSVWMKDSCGNVRAADTLHSLITDTWNVDAVVSKWTPCGDSAVLVANSTIFGNGYVSWSNGVHGSINYVTTAGVYTATVRDSNGNAMAEDSVYVELKPFRARLELHRSPVPDNDTLIVYPNDVAYNYRWYRNDTPFMSGPSPILNYPTPGVYQVYATNEAGCNATTDTIHYKIDDLTMPVDISYEVSGCDSQFVRFHGIAETQDEVTYSWNFGDQSYMEGEFASHRYAAGTYNVVLTATTSSGATGTVTKQLVITATKAIWIADITRENNQCGDTVWLTASANYARVGYFSWNTGELTQTIAVTGSGRYAVSVYDTCYNVRAYDSIDVMINAPCIPADTISIGDGPIDGGKVLPVTASFERDFNADNVFTVQLTLKNPGGRETGLQQDEVINLGTMSGTTKDIAMQVNIPDTLACATSYAVRVIASSPADTTAWSQLFTVTNQPAKPVITQRGDSLFTSGKYNWQWYLNDKAIEGATSAVYRAKANGAYTVESLNGNGCTSRSSSVSVIITAVGEVTLGGNKVKAFPNPSTGQVSLEFGKPLQKRVLVNIYNLNGRVTYSRTTSQQLQPLDLSGLPKGYYLIELTGFGEKKVLPLILQ